jgi:hypothetical protein
MTALQGRDAFLNFLKLNEELWSIEDRALPDSASDGVVLIDLLSYDMQIYNIRTLYLAKILQRQHGYRLVGLIGDLVFSRELNFGYQKNDVIAHARSFGITEFIDLEDSLPKGLFEEPGDISKEETEAAIAAIRACSNDELPQLVLGWRTAEGCRIGEYIFETTIRVARDPFIGHARPILESLTRETHFIYNAIKTLCRRRKVEVFVSGHLSYAQWGITADLVLRGGGKALWFDQTGNFSAYLLRQPPKGSETLDSQLRHIDRELFETEFRQARQLAAPFVTKLGHLFSSDYFLRPFWFEPAKSPPPALGPILRKIALRKLGWSNDPRPVVCVFIHCLSDLPRDDEQIYLDYYDWIVETLKIAVRDTSKNWIFKSHPSNKGGYDVTNTTERLKDEYKAHKHIVFLDDELQRMELFSLCDLAVTVRGSITYEMAVFGKPALLAGRSGLSDLGFCFVANSASEYERLLTRDFHTLKVSADMQERANFYLIYDRVVCRVESTFLPYWDYQLAGGNDFWNMMTERILRGLSDFDPAARVIGEMFTSGRSRTINPSFREFVDRMPKQESGSSSLRLASEPARNTTATVTVGESLSFGLERNKALALLSKPTSVDRNGSWFTGDQAACIGFVINDDSVAERETLAVGLHLFTANTEGSVHINLNGEAYGAGPARGSGAHVHIVQLDRASATKGSVVVIEVAVRDADGKQLPFRLDSLELAPGRQLRAWPEFRRFGGFRVEKDGGREFAWMPHDVELCLSSASGNKALHIAGYIPFALHHTRNNISSFELNVVVNGRILETIRTSENESFERTVALGAAGASPTIDVRLRANSSLPKDDERRELSFIVTNLSLQ